MLYPIPPTPAPRMTQSDKWKKRPCVLAYRAFRDEVRARRVQIPVPCKVTFYIPMHTSWSAKKRAIMDGAPHKQKPDTDNLAKALLDAVFGGDAHVWSIWCVKRWAQSPGIRVEPLPDDEPPNQAHQSQQIGLPLCQ